MPRAAAAAKVNKRLGMGEFYAGSSFVDRALMTWLGWLAVAVLLAAVAAITGAQPKGARPVAGTHLMGAARFVLLLFIAICAYFAFRAYGA